ncbi:MAG: hypothetical protein ABJ081_07515 [Hyphomicrobiales bacterium]
MKSRARIFISDFKRLMRASRAREKFALLRIHKTASQSFRATFRNCYKNSEDAKLNFAGVVSLEKIANKRFVSPHMTVQQWLDLEVDNDWKVGVTLREPRERLRSSYRYFRQKPDSNPTGVGTLLRKMDYTTFLKSDDPVILGLKDNIITKFIGGGSFGDAAIGRNQVNLPNQISILEAKELAFKRLASGYIIPLILECAPRSIQNASTILGIKRQPRIGWVNRSKDKQIVEYSEEIMMLENRYIEHDMEVYECANDILKLV